MDARTEEAAAVLGLGARQKTMVEDKKKVKFQSYRHLFTHIHCFNVVATLLTFKRRQNDIVFLLGYYLNLKGPGDFFQIKNVRIKRHSN